jgi:hypothetical protein
MSTKYVVGFALIINVIFWWILTIVALTEPGLSKSTLWLIIGTTVLNTFALAMAADACVVRE